MYNRNKLEQYAAGATQLLYIQGDENIHIVTNFENALWDAP